MEFQVRRTTYDKLERALNAFGAEGWQVQVIFIGGRDWVLVCSRGEDPALVGLRAAGDAIRRFDLREPTA